MYTEEIKQMGLCDKSLVAHVSAQLSPDACLLRAGGAEDDGSHLVVCDDSVLAKLPIHPTNVSSLYSAV